MKLTFRIARLAKLQHITFKEPSETISTIIKSNNEHAQKRCDTLEEFFRFHFRVNRSRIILPLLLIFEIQIIFTS